MDTVFLRAFEEDDYILINKWRNDFEIQKLTSGPIRFVSSLMEKEWVKSKMLNNQHDIYLAVCVNNDSKAIIGYTSINNINYLMRSASGGGIVIGDSKYRNGKTALAAMYQVRKYVFEELNLNRFESKCLSEHKTSLVFIQSLGSVIEGELRDTIYKTGSYHNQIILSLLKNEYELLRDSNGYSLMNILKRVKKYKKLSHGK